MTESDKPRSPLFLPILWGIYLTYMLDYMMMPALTQFFARSFQASPQELGTLISSYNFSASIFGFLGAFFLDRFHRKKALVTLYIGFGAALFISGFSSSLFQFIIARTVAGFFGGLMIATLFSMIGDEIDAEHQGMAFGTVLSSFSIASVIGVPSGLFLAEKGGWPLIFQVNGIVAAIIGAIAVFKLTPSRNQTLASESFRKRAITLLTSPSNYAAFFVSIFIAMASASVIPYINPFLSLNRGLSDSEIRSFYIVGGLVTFFVSFPVGYLSDRFGKHRVFYSFSILLFPISIFFASMPSTLYAVMMIIFVLFMTLSRARRIPALAILTPSVEPGLRAAFLSIVTSLEQLFSGIAVSISGLVILKTSAGIERFEAVGIGSAIFSLLALVFIRFVNRRNEENLATNQSNQNINV
ncbi:MAG: MFS transporter [Chloroherpetonaceae bacterium]|nr:MFS transporter [Chloroherpetonaceae bacterium]